MRPNLVRYLAGTFGMLAIVGVATSCSNDVTSPETAILSPSVVDPLLAPTIVAGAGTVTVTGRFSPETCGKVIASARLNAMALTIYITSVGAELANCPGILRSSAYTVVVSGLKPGALTVDVLQDGSRNPFDAKAPQTIVTVL